MRNLLLLCAAFGLTTAANAQNTASTSQSGNDNSADVNQTYVAGDVSTMNVATIVQVGSNLDARARQQGAGNLVDIDQSGNAHSARAEELLGYSNDIEIVQTGGDAAAQTGGNNDARISVRGDLNEVYIGQDGDRNRVNVNMQTQQNDGNILDLQQVGSGNQLDMRFKSRNDDNTVTTYQIGTGNTLGAVGGGADGVTFENQADDNTLDAYQDGESNAAQITFTEFALTNTVNLDQFGAGNDATILVTGDNNMATVLQDGTGNMADVMQNGSGNTATITQQ